MPQSLVPSSAPLLPSRRAFLAAINSFSLAITGFPFRPRLACADLQPTDDAGGPKVDTEQGLIFVAGPKGPIDFPPIPHELGVRFTGAYEQTVTLYQWQDAPTDPSATNANAQKPVIAQNGGSWKRRVFLNSYYQGSAITLSIDLDAGRKFLLVAYHKDAEAPATGQDWAQSRLDHGDVTKMTERRRYPLVEAVFKHDKGSALVWLRPEARTAPASQPSPTTQPSVLERPLSKP